MFSEGSDFLEGTLPQAGSTWTGLMPSGAYHGISDAAGTALALSGKSGLTGSVICLRKKK